MKKHFIAAMLAAAVIFVPFSAMAQVSISIGIPLPPVIRFPGPIEVVVIPDTYLYDVYAVPDVEEDLFFCRGWWWLLWEGRWYRSRYYDRGWVYYRYVPDFYYDIYPGWRGFYRARNWHGHPWGYRRIPYHEVEKNWSHWNSRRYWERERKWDVERHQPIPPHIQQEMRRQRQREFVRRPEVQRHEQWKREHQRMPQGGEFQGQPQRRPDVRGPERQQDRRPGMQVPQDPRQGQPQGLHHHRPRDKERPEKD